MNASKKPTLGFARILPAAIIGTGMALGLGVLAGCPVEETPRREPAPAPTEPMPPRDTPGTQPGTEPGTQPGRQPGTPDDPYGP